MIIDCSKNPMDIRPVISATLQRYWAIKNSDPDAKVAILCGKHHQMSAHRMISAGILASIPSATLANEFPHNFYEWTFNFVRQKNAKLGPLLRYTPQDIVNRLDTYGGISAEFFMVNVETRTADEARNGTWRYCISERRKMIFVDAAKTIDSKHLDLKDTLTAEFAQHKKRPISVMANKGIAIRNKMMAHLCGNEDDIILPTGSVHLFGDFTTLKGYEDSLANLYTKNNVHVIAVVPCIDQGMEDNLQKSPYVKNHETIIVRGLDNKKFTNENWEDEIKYCHAMIHSSGQFMAPNFFR